MSKVEIPKLEGSLTAFAINGWLHHVDHSFESWSGLGADKVLKVELQILLGGLKMEDPVAAEW
jgi:hypothetical protein